MSAGGHITTEEAATEITCLAQELTARGVARANRYIRIRLDMSRPSLRGRYSYPDA